MNLTFSITELSNLTGKTRPTIYKYLKAYEEDKYDDLPYSFIQLFDLMNEPYVTRQKQILNPSIVILKLMKSLTLLKITKKKST